MEDKPITTEQSSTDRMVLTVLGFDRPGIIAAITRILFEQDCNIENVSQMILQSEFVGIFIVGAPPDITLSGLQERLEDGLSPMGLSVFLKPLSGQAPYAAPKKTEPIVVTTKGPDRKGLVASVTEVIARHKANVANLSAVFRGGEDPDENFMIYEIDVPSDIDSRALYRDLRDCAGSLNLTITIQHRKIFEAINRV